MKDQIVQPDESPVQKDAYTVKEIADLLGMKVRTAHHFCSTTEYFKVKRVGRLLRVNKQSFDEWWNG